MTISRKQHAPAADRNRGPILSVLQEVLPARGTVLEVASGTGQHAVHFAAKLPGITWQPTDANPDAVASIEAWRQELALVNLRAPLRLDVTTDAWPMPGDLVAIVCINMIHIAPWRAAEALLEGAGRLLPEGGALILYGPFFRDDVQTAQSNLDFDAGLRARDPFWGVRRLEDVAAAAAARGLGLERTIDMPSNNMTVLFRKMS